MTPREEILDLKGELALEKSIRKWNDIVRGVGVDRASSNCELCKNHRDDIVIDCSGCPVYEEAQISGCRGTPYEEFIEHYDEKHPQGHGEWSKNGRVIKCDKCVELAIKELEFLKSLRKEKS